MSFERVSDLDPALWSVPLPEFVDASKIGVNFNHISRLARIGCFSGEVSVRGQSGEVTQYTPMLAGGDEAAGYAALGGSVKRAALSDSESPDHNFWPLLHQRHPLALRVNTSEMEQRLQRAGVPLRNPNHWAGILNESISQGLRNAAWKHCVKRPHYGELTLFGLSLTAAVALATTRAPDTIKNFSTVLTQLFLNNIGRAISGRVESIPLKDICWSITPGIHPDRALLVSGLSRVMKSVKVIR